MPVVQIPFLIYTYVPKEKLILVIKTDLEEIEEK